MPHRNTWHEIGDKLWDFREERLAPTKDELRQRFVAALNSVPDYDEAALADFVQQVSKVVRISPPSHEMNIAPFGLGRITKLIMRRPTFFKTPEEGQTKRPMPSATGHILNEDGHPLCDLKAEVERVVDNEHSLSMICSPCQKAREGKPWPKWIYPFEDHTGGLARRLIDFNEARQRRA